MGAFAEWQPRYAEHGIITFPVVVDEKRKKPAVKGYLKIGLPTSGQLAIKFPNHDALGLACKRSRISVLDVDTTDERELAEGLAKFGPSPFIVRSGSGHFQAWYRNNGEPRRIRPDPERPIDILGHGYVVAPPSMGARGRYEIIQGTMDDLDRLPAMNPLPVSGGSSGQPENFSTSRKPELSERSDKGRQRSNGMRAGDGRNNTLFHRALRQARQATTQEELIQMVSNANQQFAEPLPADEVLSVSNSAWKYKMQNRIMVGGGEATAVVFKSDREHLWDSPLALSLLVDLRMENGWRNGAPFPLGQGMAKAMGVSIPTFRAARDVLVDRYFLEIIHPGGRGKNDPPIVRLL